MGNREIAAQFNLLAALMELHGENAFKTKSYLNAYQSLRKWDRPLTEMSKEEITAIHGVGASAAAKIEEIIATGSMEPLEKLKAKTPHGIQQLLSIKGMGPKKIRTIWDALGVETPAELLYACNENRLVKLPGFGLKTQEDLCAKITYFLDSQNRYLFGVIDRDLHDFEKKWTSQFPKHDLIWAGDMATKNPIVSAIECIISPAFDVALLEQWSEVSLISKEDDGIFSILYNERYTIRCKSTSVDDIVQSWALKTFSDGLLKKFSPVLSKHKGSEPDVFLSNNGFKDLPHELLDYEGIEDKSPDFWKDIVMHEDIRGIVHNHSTYSDGIHTLEEMAMHVRDAGYGYFGICDHSQSAFYANGLSSERVLDQMDEIDRLNKKMAPFVILKGIESDILPDGSLDYEDDLLGRFDMVVASIHSNLRMDEEKATARLIKAIENPYTHILGHPTSRLLLARPGYPISYKKLIDACAANGVAMELNANPQRMDIDYHWMDYCQEKGVWVSINPDAHSRFQVGYIKYGVYSARKGGLKKQNCLNAMDLNAFREWLQTKRRNSTAG